MITLQPSGLVGNPHFNFGFATNLQKSSKTLLPVSRKNVRFFSGKNDKVTGGRKKVGQHKTGGCSRLGSDIILVKKYP